MQGKTIDDRKYTEKLAVFSICSIGMLACIMLALAETLIKALF